MPISEGEKRVGFNVSAETGKRLDALPWGTRSQLLRIMTEKLLDAIDTQGQIVIGAILSGQYRLVYEPQDSVPNRDDLEKRRA